MRVNESSTYEHGLLMDTACCTPMHRTSSHKNHSCLRCRTSRPIISLFPSSNIHPSKRWVNGAHRLIGRPTQVHPVSNRNAATEHSVPCTTRRVRPGDQRTFHTYFYYFSLYSRALLHVRPQPPLTCLYFTSQPCPGHMDMSQAGHQYTQQK